MLSFTCFVLRSLTYFVSVFIFVFRYIFPSLSVNDSLHCCVFHSLHYVFHSMLSDVRSGIFCDVFSIVLRGLLDIYLRIQLSTVSFCLPTLWTTVNSRRHARLSINLRTCLNWMESHLWFTGNNHKIGGGSHSSSSQTERKRPKKEWVKSKVRQTHFSSRDISSNPLFWLLYISQLANLRTCSFLCRGIDTSVSWALIVFLPRDCYSSTLRTTSFLRHLIIIKVFRALPIFFFIWLLR